MFTNLTSVGNINRVYGHQDGSAAGAGEVGEVIATSVATPGVTLTTAVAAIVASAILTPGEWDIQGVIDWLFAATTSYTQLQGGISYTQTPAPVLIAQGTQTNAVDGTVIFNNENFALAAPATVPTALPFTSNIQQVRVLVPANAAPKTMSLIALATFTVAGLQAFGTIRARRAR